MQRGRASNGLCFPSKPPISSFPPAPQHFAEQCLHTCVWEDLWGLQGSGTWKKAMQGVGILNLGVGGGECTQSSSISWVSFVPENSLRKQSQLLETRSSRTWGTDKGREKKRGFPLPAVPKTSLTTGSWSLIASGASSFVSHSHQISSSVKPNWPVFNPQKEPTSLRLHELRSPQNACWQIKSILSNLWKLHGYACIVSLSSLCLCLYPSELNYICSAHFGTKLSTPCFNKITLLPLSLLQTDYSSISIRVLVIRNLSEWIAASFK